jgi:urocanate hydratase
VVRHADAGYETALRVARERGLDMPSLAAGPGDGGARGGGGGA